jgi:hypothetical protein
LKVAGLIFTACLILIPTLLYIPLSGNLIGMQALRYAGKAMGMRIGAERVKVSFPLDLTISGAKVSLPDAEDALMSAGTIRISVRPAPLLSKIVYIDTLSLQNIRLATDTLVAGMELNGSLGSLSAKAAVSVPGERVTVYNLALSDADLTLRIDSATQEEESEPLGWKIDASRLALSHIRFMVHIPADTLSLYAGMEEAELADAGIDLRLSRYAAGRMTVTGGRIAFDGDNREPHAGLDPVHIDVSDLNLSADSLLYQGRVMNAGIRALAMTERSGLKVVSMEGTLASDSSLLRIPGLQLETPASRALLRAAIPWSALGERPEGNMQVSLSASIGKSDVLLSASDLPDDFRAAYPDSAASLSAALEGNLARLDLRQLSADLPGAFSFLATGQAGDMADSSARWAQVRLEAQVRRLDFALNLLPAPQRERFAIPGGISLSAEGGLKDGRYSVSALLARNSGRVGLKGSYHAASGSYDATLDIDSLEPAAFLPSDSLLWLEASLSAEGRGTDMFADSAWGVWQGRLKSVRYGPSLLENVSIDGSLRDHRAQLALKSLYPFAADVTFDGSLYRNGLTGMLTGNVDSLDLQRLNLTPMPLATSFQLFAEIESDMEKTHRADLTLGNWELDVSGRSVKPKTLTLQALAGADTSRLSFHVGDFGIVLTARDGPEALADRLAGIAGGIDRQMKADSTLDLDALRPLFPDMSLSIHAGKDNPVYNILRQYDIDVNELDVKASSSPPEGLMMDAAVYALQRDTFRIDTVRAFIRPDTAGLIYRAEVIKNAYRRQQPFTAQVQGSLRRRYADAELLYANSTKETGLRLGVRGVQEDGGDILLSLFPYNPVVAFNTFTLNPDNYIRFRSIKDIEADVRFTGKANSSLWFHSVHDGGDFAEVHAELNRIDMNVVSTGFAGMPRMEGMMSADLRYAPSEESFMVVGGLHVDSLRYEGGEVGELMLNAVYLPLDGLTHQIDAHLYHDRAEVASATAVYDEAGKGISGSLSVDTLPMSRLTPFVPDGMASLGGRLNARLDVAGSGSAPVVNGYVQLDTGSVYTSMTASRFRIDDKKLEVKDNRVVLNGFRLYAAGKNPLSLDGDVSLAGPAGPVADLRLRGNDLQLLDVRRNDESMVYGRLLASVDATLKGPLETMTVRGDIKLLGGTDMTYVMKESPLTVQDRLKDLVTFTSFADTTLRRRGMGSIAQLSPPGGMDMLMLIHIDPSVALRADLTPDRSSYVALEGGGDLSFQYTRQGEMRLNGRYALSDGRLRYALPVIPLKEFRISDGSYLQWDGDPVNPTIGLAATQRMRTSVSLLGEAPRMVNFDVGIDVRQRLENMSLLFTIAAPEDASVQSELDKMGADGRSTQAVAMMATGMYLAGGASGKVNLNMGSALTNFLRNEISSIAGDALQTVDFSFGVDTYDPDAEMGAGQRTDYSFRFAKRFYNDRLRFVVGGKVSTGDVEQKEAFIDNASLEWRVNKAGTGYLKVFHDKNYKSIFDGEVTETGLGIVLRRRMRYLYELFR